MNVLMVQGDNFDDLIGKGDIVLRFTVQSVNAVGLSRDGFTNACLCSSAADV